jgi:1-acyl-sn-glycerol-3-phosphate acyltransferase
MIVSWIRIAFIALYTSLMSVAAFLSAFVFRSPAMYHKVGRWYGMGVLFISGIRLAVEGLERVDFSRNYIYVSNHASMFDIPAVLAAVPAGISLMYKKELHRVPVFGWSLMLSKVYIPVDRGSSSGAMRSIEDAARKIHNGLSVLLFAEGTRTSDGELQQFKRGAFSLAVKADVPVVPVTVNGSFHVMSRDSFRIRPGKITVVLETPIQIPSGEGKSAEIVLRDGTRSAIERHYVPQKPAASVPHPTVASKEPA